MKAVLNAGHRVIGIEYVQLGVEAFFEETNIAHEIVIDEENKCQIYQVKHMEGFRNRFHPFV